MSALWQQISQARLLVFAYSHAPTVHNLEALLAALDAALELAAEAESDTAAGAEEAGLDPYVCGLVERLQAARGRALGTPTVTIAWDDSAGLLALAIAAMREQTPPAPDARGGSTVLRPLTPEQRRRLAAIRARRTGIETRDPAPWRGEWRADVGGLVTDVNNSTVVQTLDGPLTAFLGHAPSDMDFLVALVEGDRAPAPAVPDA